MNIFHFRPAQSVLHSLHPLTKILLTLLLSSLALDSSLLFSVLLAVVLNVTLILIRVPLKHYGKEGKFFFLIIPVIGIFTYSHSKDLIETAQIVTAFFSMIELSILLLDTTAFDDLSMAIGSVLSLFSKKKGYRIASTIELTLAMIPLLFDITQSVSLARRARGEKMYRHPVRSVSQYVTGVLTLVFIRVEQLELALKARQFDPDKEREKMKPEFKDIIFFLSVSSGSVVLYLFI